MTLELDDLAFGAANTLPKRGNTRLEIRILHPEKDRPAFEAMLRNEHQARELAYRNLCFGSPHEVTVEYAFGPDRGIIRDYQRIYLPKDVRPDSPPRVPVSILGAVSSSVTDELLDHTCKQGDQQRRNATLRPVREPIPLELDAGEVQQVFVRLRRKNPSTRGAYLLAVDHWLEFDRKNYIGGFRYLMLTPHDPFHCEKPRSFPPSVKSIVSGLIR